MRVLKFLVSSLLVVGVICVLAALATREALLASSVSQMKDALRLLKSVEEKGEYASNCLGLGAVPDENGRVYTGQLRFTSDTEYVLEVICNQFWLNPIQVKADQLKPLVKKLPGQAGIIWGDSLSGITLSIMGRSSQIFVLEREIVTAAADSYDFVNESVGPVASCSGYGYGCCLDDSQQGSGTQLEGVTDCPKSCFSQCQERPVVLSFHTQPFYDTATRTLTIANGDSVSFSYVVSDTQTDKLAKPGTSFSETTDETGATVDAQVSTMESVMAVFQAAFDKQNVAVASDSAYVRVDFGDGDSLTLPNLQGLSDHRYDCATGNCEYQARITATNGFGITSADSVLNSIRVVVQ